MGVRRPLARQAGPAPGVHRAARAARGGGARWGGGVAEQRVCAACCWGLGKAAGCEEALSLLARSLLSALNDAFVRNWCC